MSDSPPQDNSAIDALAKIDKRVRSALSVPSELLEPASRLNFEARRGDPVREFKHLHQMCLAHAVSFARQNKIKLGYVIQAYLTAVDTRNPLGMYASARTVLEFHAWTHYVIKKLRATQIDHDEDWKKRGEEFFHTIVRAKYATSVPRKKEVQVSEGTADADLKPFQIMTCLDHLKKENNFNWARTHYETLCD